ncbi:hypothetical protein AVEN_263734-1 [Araneus ventricosus]|uniref:Tc3 transposase DNA binding domain-containing protein n=1 Tax=Araneus ventricosus TaxID=182803 RepID=A0A4Y2AUP7_ARAVE|nr:hypothetical protein AVEN_263734-1 [Araneus ventricosus]
MYLQGEITPEEREIAIKVANVGETFRKIGKIVVRTHSSMQRVISNYNSSKSVSSKPRNGRPSKLSNHEKRYIFKSVHLNPRISASEIANGIRKRFEKKLFMKTLYGKLRKKT